MKQSSVPARAWVRALVAEWLRGFARRPTTVAVAAVVGALAVYLINVGLLARRYEGVDSVPAGAPVTAGPSAFQAFVAWMLVSTVVSATLTALWTRGRRRFWRDLVELRNGFANVWRIDRASASVHLLYGMAMALIVGNVLAPPLRAATALAILFALSTRGGAVAASIYASLHMRYRHEVTGLRLRRIELAAAAAVTATGVCLGLLVASLFDALLPTLLLAATAAGSAFALRKRGPRVRRGRVPTGTLLGIMIVACLGALWLMGFPPQALADDGGWTECVDTGGTWISWLGCDSSGDVLRQSGDGGVAGGGGGGAGGALGSMGNTRDGDATGAPPPADDDECRD